MYSSAINAIHTSRVQNFTTLMYQDFQDDDVIELELECSTQSNTQCNAPITQRIYSVDDLSELLQVKRRQVFNLVKVVKTAHSWLPENEFSPSLGKYSDRCLVELRRLQACKSATEYTKLVASENQKPIVPNVSTSLAIPQRQTELLEAKLATLQGNLNAQNLSIQDRVKLAMARIQEEKQRANNNAIALDEARKQALILKATQDALQEHDLYQQVKNAIREQLLLEEI